MNTTIVAALVGLLSGLAAVAIVAGLTPTDPAATAVRPGIDWRQRTRRWGTTGLVGAAAILAWVTTGWPVAALGVVVAGWLIPHSIATASNQRREREMVDATRMWLLQLRTTLQAGVGMESALRETARQTRPDSPIAIPLRRAVDRLEWMAPSTTLGLLATDLDNHVADTAAVVLSSALTHSQQGVAEALTALGIWADQDLAQLREVEAQARVLRLTRRIIIGIFVVLAIYLAVTSPALMAPYATVAGQAVLMLLGGLATVAVWLLGRLSTLHRPERFFRDREVVS